MARGKDKKKRKLEKKQEGDDVPKKVPHTLESLREKDETMLANVEAEEQEEAQKDMELDELSSYFENSYEPKVLITYSDNPHAKTRIFGKELSRMIPNALSRYRQRFPSNDIRCIEWTNIVRRQRREEYWQPNSSSRICSVHFKEEDKYKSPKGLTVLKKTAVPIYEEPSRIYIRRRSASPNSLEGEDISDLDSIFDSPLTAAFKQHISKLSSEKDELRQKNRNLSCRVRRLQKKVIKLKTIIKNLKKKKVVSVVEEEEEEEDEEEESVIGDKVETQM